MGETWRVRGLDSAGSPCCNCCDFALVEVSVEEVTTESDGRQQVALGGTGESPDATLHTDVCDDVGFSIGLCN